MMVLLFKQPVVKHEAEQNRLHVYNDTPLLTVDLNINR